MGPERLPPLPSRVQLVRRDGRDVSTLYGGMDETCPLCTGGRGRGSQRRDLSGAFQGGLEGAGGRAAAPERGVRGPGPVRAGGGDGGRGQADRETRQAAAHDNYVPLSAS